MKERRFLKRVSVFFIAALCMVSVVVYAEEGKETKSVCYESRTYNLTEESVPEKDGYLFAGWFTSEDEEIYKAVSEPQDSTKYYAKFVPEEVLTIKAQVSDTLYDDNPKNDDTAAIRFVTTIDHSMDYKEVGFKIKKGSNGAEEDAKVSNYVYRTIYAIKGVSSEDGPGEAEKYSPEEKFHPESYYFKTWTIGNIKDSAYNTEITVTPYWITLDGTRVEGTTSIKTVNLGRSWIYAANEANADGKEYGTFKHPYTTIAAAVDVDTAIDRTVILKSDMNVDATVTIDENVTLTSENGVTVKRADDQTGAMFDVTAGTFTIQGLKGEEVVIDGNAGTEAVNTRAVNVAADAMFNMTYGVIQNFYSNQYGATVYSYGSIDIRNCSFINNQTTQSGGAIYENSTNPFAITDCVFTNNHVTKQGGAIYFQGTKNHSIELIRCTFDNNSSVMNGGVVYIANTNTLKVEDSSFNNNTATATGQFGGGAVFMNTKSSALELSGKVTFENNTIEGGSLGGGAVVCGSTFKITEGAQVTFMKNTALDALAGALYINTDSIAEFTLEEDASLVMADNADKNGATDIAVRDLGKAQFNLNGDYKISRIWAEAGTLITLGENAKNLNDKNRTMVYLDGTVNEDTQLVKGSMAADKIFAVSASQTVTLKADGYLEKDDRAVKIVHGENSDYYKSLAEALNKAEEGDTIILMADIRLEEPLTINKAVTITTDHTSIAISFPESISDFPIKVNADREVTFEGCSANAKLTFVGTGNKSCSYSILSLEKAESVTMKYVNMQNANRNGKDGGGAINSLVPLTLTNCDFANCKVTASGKYGGAIWMDKMVALTVKDCMFSNCQATSSGGAIYSGNKVELINCTFTANTTSSGGGGAIYVANENMMTIGDCTFTGNSAKTYGGAVGMGTAASTLNFEGTCMFEGNTVTGNGKHFGGAVFAPRNLYIKEGAYVMMTGNECTGYNYGDAISINGTSTNTKFIIESGAALYVWDNPNAGDDHNDICLYDSSEKGEGVPAEPTVDEGGLYSTSAP